MWKFNLNHIIFWAQQIWLLSNQKIDLKNRFQFTIFCFWIIEKFDSMIAPGASLPFSLILSYSNILVLTLSLKRYLAGDVYDAFYFDIKYQFFKTDDGLFRY